MSHSHVTASASQSRDFQRIFDDAAKAYKERTKKGLLDHSLADRLWDSESPEDILSVLKGLNLQFQGRQARRFERWLNLNQTVKIVYTLSQTLGSGVALVRPISELSDVALLYSPAKAIFIGIGTLLLAAKGIQGNLVGQVVAIFQRIGMFLRRLEIYTQVQQTKEMMDKIVQIMAEVITILGIATKEIKQGRIKKCGKKLIGRTDMEDAMQKFDKLTREEAWISIVKVMRAVHAIDETVAMASIGDKH